LADAKGQLKVENFNSEDFDELSITCECDDRTHPARERIYVRFGDWKTLDSGVRTLAFGN